MLGGEMSEDVPVEIPPYRMKVQKMTNAELLQICKPCTVLLDKLPDTVFGGLSKRQIRARRLHSAQNTKFQRKIFEEARYENAKERAKTNQKRKIAVRVTQKSARRRGWARRFRKSVKKNSTSHDDVRKQSCHLFTAFSEMLSSLSPGGDTNFLLTEEESLIVGVLLDLPNVVRAKVVEIAAKTSGWVRVNSEEISSEWLERLRNNGTICVAADFPGEFSTILNVLSVPVLKGLCKKLGLPSNLSKPILIRELTIAQLCDVDVLKMPTDDDGIYNMRRIVRVEEPVRLVILKTAHLFLLPLRDFRYFREPSNPILKILYSGLPLNPLLKSIKFDGYSEIFKNKEEFARWAEARQVIYTIEKAIISKKWNLVEEISMKEFYNVSSSKTRQSEIPDGFDIRPEILRQFSEKFVKVGVLSCGVEALVSSGTNLRLAEEVLHLLLKQPDRSVEERCWWRYLLALLFEKTSLVEKAVDMVQQAWKQACGNCESCRSKLSALVKRLSHEQSEAFAGGFEKIGAFKEEPRRIPLVVIQKKSAIQGFQGLKRVYNGIENGTGSHLSVEDVVMDHFRRNGYPKGLDDEGRTLMNLCYSAVWEETYATGVPYVFCAPWQAVPLDWGTPLFWVTREKQLKEKLQKLSGMQPEELAMHLSGKRDSIGKVAGSVNWNLLNFDPTGMLTCLTTPLFATLCERFLSGGRRGFPDLFLWNEEEEKCLFVEVKGPKDKMSSCQWDWLEFINDSKGEAVVAEVRE